MIFDTLNSIFNQIQSLTIVSSSQNVQKLQSIFQGLQQAYSEAKQLQQEKEEFQAKGNSASSKEE